MGIFSDKEIKKAKPLKKSKVPAVKPKADTSKQRTEAQEIMASEGYDPFQMLMGLSKTYMKMLSSKKNWEGKDATEKELQTYAKEYSSINISLAQYKSPKAPLKEPKDLEEITADNENKEDPTQALSTADLAKANREMRERTKANLEERF